jgi:catechol 2,3-dioxygenase-like lactoylglutathione lyase family enzyme
MDVWSRREFLERACLVVAAHAGLQAFAFSAEPVQKPVEFQSVRLHTAKLPELEQFYRKTLGLPVTKTENGMEVRAGSSILEFAGVAAGSEPFYHFAFNIPENKLGVAMEWLRPRCAIFKNPNTGQEIYHFVNWNAHSCYFHDPAGNILEFIARHTLPNAAPGGFSTRDILSVSEIALVAPDLGPLADRLKNGLDISDYPGTSPEFMPVGNEYGLFILVRSGRIWLGGTSQATVYPVEVLLHGGHPMQLRWEGLPYLVKSSTG